MSDVKEIKNLKELIPEFLTDLEHINNQTSQGLSTVFYNLDYITNGLHNSSLNVIAGRPAMGKTALAFNIAVNMAQKEKVPVVIFSLEMSKEQCISRIISSEAVIPNSKFKKGKLDDKDWDKIAEATAKLSETEIYIDETAGISITEIEEKCKKLKLEKDIVLVIVDCIQLVSADKETSREQELSTISRSLVHLSKELNIPILVTSQLSRAPENRYNKGQSPRPTLKDFRISGSDALMQDADVIMFLYSDEYCDIKTPNKEIAEVIIAKNRYGSCGIVTLKKLLYGSKFKDLEYKEEKR